MPQMHSLTTGFFQEVISAGYHVSPRESGSQMACATTPKPQCSLDIRADEVRISSSVAYTHMTTRSLHPGMLTAGSFSSPLITESF